MQKKNKTNFLSERLGKNGRILNGCFSLALPDLDFKCPDEHFWEQLMLGTSYIQHLIRKISRP